MLNISKKTKIVCTIGPASDTYEKICALVDNGMNIMRLNFSHGEYPSHLAKIELARRIEKEKGIYLPVMLDTKGPEIRTGLFKDDQALIPDKSIFRISMKEVLGTSEKFSITYEGLYDDVKVGDHIKFDDGNLDVVIIEMDDKNRELVCQATNTHTLKNRKGVNVPAATLSMPFISEKDENDLKFGCENGITFVAASFTRRAQDIIDIKKILTKYGRPDVKVIAKIENPEGVKEIDKIIDASDGIMVARGDLGVEVPPEIVPVIQKTIIQKCRKKGKPVITATQMLDSMQTHPRPTRAEVSDVATAIAESSDAVMLSGESASGLYPVEACAMQAKISETIEESLPYEQFSLEAYETSEKSNNDAIANSIANTALLIGAKLIINFSETGKSTYRISKARPCCPILSVSNKRQTVLESGVYWGVQSVYIPTPMPSFIEDMESLAIVKAFELNLKPGTPIILSGGTPSGAGKTNFMRILSVPEKKDI